MSDNTTWAIIGGGNGGQSLAGHLSIMGFPVRLFDIFEETVEAINKQGGIHVTGVVEGFGKLEFATTDIGKALEGADVAMIVAPAVAHKTIAQSCAPHLVNGQIVIIHPGATCGTLEFKQVLNDSGCTADVTVSETNSLIYACRSPKPGHASILGIKEDLVLASIPNSENPRVLSLIQKAFPQIVGGKNVLEPSLGNANAIVHPAPTLLNTSMIESKHEWLYYHEGITPSIGDFVEALDKERVDLAKSFGIDVVPIKEWYRIAYNAEGENLSEAVKNNEAYAGIQGQKSLRTRYLLEDIPTGLIPMVELGKLQGIPMPRMQLIIDLGQYLLQEDFYKEGRTLTNLGLEGMTGDDLTHYIETGHK